MRGVELVAADDDHGNTVAPRVVDRHRRVLQADGAVAQREERLARDLEVAVRHGDRRFLVHAGEEFRHAVAAVVDQRFVQGTIARSAIRRHVLDVERLDDVDHEIRTGNPRNARELAWRLRFGLDRLRRGWQR